MTRTTVRRSSATVLAVTLVILMLVITGCQTTLDPNFAVQMEAYRFTISSQREVEVARAKAEEARYIAMGQIAERSDAQTKNMAIMALALGGRSTDTHSASVPVQLPRIPETQEDRALKWAAIFSGPTTALVSSYFGYQLGKTQSNNQADTTQASYAALVAMKPTQPFAPTTATTTVNNITTTSTTDLWNRDGFVIVGGTAQQAPTTGAQDNSPVNIIPPVVVVPPVFSPVPVTPTP